MAYMDEIYLLLADNGVGDITAEDLRDSFDLLDGNSGKLFEITEDSKTGFRLYNDTYLNYGYIGENAVDLSIQPQQGIDNGAKGSNSFVTGLGTKTAVSCNVFGKYNLGLNNTTLEIGNGTDDLNRSNLMEIYNTGVITISASIDDIEAADSKTLITKEYLYNNSFNSNVISETNQTYYTPDLQVANYFEYTLTQNSTINNPINLIKGQHGYIIIKEDQIGNWEISFGSYWIAPNGTPIIDTNPGVFNIFTYVVIDIDKILINSIADIV